MTANLVVHKLLDPLRGLPEQRDDVFRALEASGGDPKTFLWIIERRVELPGNPYQLTVTAYAKEPIDDAS